MILKIKFLIPFILLILNILLLTYNISNINNINNVKLIDNNTEVFINQAKNNIEKTYSKIDKLNEKEVDKYVKKIKDKYDIKELEDITQSELNSFTGDEKCLLLEDLDIIKKCLIRDSISWIIPEILSNKWKITEEDCFFLEKYLWEFDINVLQCKINAATIKGTLLKNIKPCDILPNREDLPNYSWKNDKKNHFNVNKENISFFANSDDFSKEKCIDLVQYAIMWWRWYLWTYINKVLEEWESDKSIITSNIFNKNWNLIKERNHDWKIMEEVDIELSDELFVWKDWSIDNILKYIEYKKEKEKFFYKNPNLH